MADVDESQFSLMSLEDELTCSICLSPFNCPVTIPCGHNFCQDCLLETWKDSYSCPQCRTLFATKPELKKNTVLSTVVETFNSRTAKKAEKTTLQGEESKAQKKDVIRCDTCMEAEAARTCLTCMASFCEEHLRPHRENPKFSVHQLTELVGDLSERICQDHHKLMEFFCSQHGRPICSFCLQQAHKGCSFMTPEEQRSLKESDLRDKLGLLDGKIEKTDTVILQISDMQSKLKDAATNRKTAFAAVYQQMRDMLAQEEHKAQHDVDNELETAQTKLQDFMKRFTENSENMRKAREDLNSLLSQTESLAFLKASFDLPRVVKFDPYAPRVNLDSKKVMASQAFATALKERLTEILTQPVEARFLMLKPGERTDEKAAPVSGCTGSQSESEPKGQPNSQSFGCPPMQQYFQPVPVPVYMEPPGGWNPSHYSQGQSQGSHRGPPFMGGQKPYKKSDTSHHSFNKQDRKPHTAPAWDGPKRDNPGGNKPSGKGPDGPKRDNPGGNKPSGKGPDGPRRDNPRSHPSSGKSAKSHPWPNKNN